MKLTGILEDLVSEGLNLQRKVKPPKVLELSEQMEEFLRDMAQMVGGFDYTDIYKFGKVLTPEKIKRLQEIYWLIAEEEIPGDEPDVEYVQSLPEYKELVSIIKSHELSEGLNLQKKDPTTYAKSVITNLVNRVSEDDNYITYYDNNDNPVMDYNKNGKYEKGWLAISAQRIYDTIQRMFPSLSSYDRLIPFVRIALDKIREENIFKIPAEINYINNMDKIETLWFRKHE